MKKTSPVKQLGAASIPSPLLSSSNSKSEEFQFVSDEDCILHNVSVCSTSGEQSPFSFEKAGPRSHSYFDSSKVRAGIVTCGGLCPGINNVIRTIVMQLYHNYGVQRIHGFCYGFQGFIPSYQHEITDLTPENVRNIHNLGGSILSSSRGPQNPAEIVDCLERNNIRILFCIGGDGTLHGAHAIAKEVQQRNLKISIIGIPKTIDNDIPYCVKTFGFETAFSKAVEAVQAAHSEAYGYNYGVVIIKLMGRNSGFIAANTSLACPDVNFVLIPEVPFTIDGEKGLLRSLERGFETKKEQGKHPHSVIVVAEGAGQDLLGNDGEDRDASGNVRFKDIGLYLKDEIEKYFADRSPVNLKLIEPSYLIRSLPANPHDAIFCYYLADNAVHAAMSGKTDMMIGYWNGHFTHVPLDVVIQEKKRINPDGEFWRQVLFSTGQPGDMYSPQI
ncbi:MAG: ATP-dependent 6-phosphofructokinase [SAR324 cluster bacterium]|nr:ATP-dependent 6-phosphofructokinase [SAR324 cluster bacterium]MBL7034624.1 ATP-dependent 6-phosphofructokinase [SAR324 cluster bacterium]